MSIFTDDAGEEWRLEFDGFLLDRIANETKVDLASFTVDGLLAVERDVKALVRVLAVACGDEIKQRGKTAAQFQKHIRKEAITRARKALMEGLADFFPQSEWSAIQSTLKRRKKEPEMSPEQLQLAAGFLRMDPEVQKDVMSLIQQEMAGSLLSSTEDGSAPDQDTMPPLPADGSPESAESAPEALPSGTSG